MGVTAPAFMAKVMIAPEAGKSGGFITLLWKANEAIEPLRIGCRLRIIDRIGCRRQAWDVL